MWPARWSCPSFAQAFHIHPTLIDNVSYLRFLIGNFFSVAFLGSPFFLLVCDSLQFLCEPPDRECLPLFAITRVRQDFAGG
jgi:hypothetical protein